MEHLGTFQIVPKIFINIFIHIMAFGFHIKDLRIKAGLSVRELAEAMGVSMDRLAKWEQKDFDPRSEDRSTIECYFGIDLEAILNLKEIPKKLLKERLGNDTKKRNVPREQTSYLEKRRGIKNSEKADIPVFGSFTTLGNVTVYNDDRMKNEVIAGLPPALFPNCNYAERAKGQSMYPLIMNQALLVGYNGSIQSLTYGEIYIIKTKDGLDTTKYVHPGTDDSKIKLKAYNKSVPEQEISLEDVTFVCRIHWIINPT